MKKKKIKINLTGFPSYNAIKSWDAKKSGKAFIEGFFKKWMENKTLLVVMYLIFVKCENLYTDIYPLYMRFFDSFLTSFETQVLIYMYIYTCVNVLVDMLRTP